MFETAFRLAAALWGDCTAFQETGEKPAGRLEKKG
jgi:hypothetical protein